MDMKAQSVAKIGVLAAALGSLVYMAKRALSFTKEEEKPEPVRRYALKCSFCSTSTILPELVTPPHWSEFHSAGRESRVCCNKPLCKVEMARYIKGKLMERG